MTTQVPPLLISRFQVRVLSGSPTSQPTDSPNGHPPMPTIVQWAFAPDWLSPAEAAALLGPAYTVDSILALIDLGAIEAERTGAAGAWLVGKRSLHEYQESLWEVLTDE